ncbi:MAG: hypothetical protein K0R54_2118 [Clostridiaceae bacterium]|jgi:competence protein ComEA|nr:hypothetical protein [Clostridiaceae bacterium]
MLESEVKMKRINIIYILSIIILIIAFLLGFSVSKSLSTNINQNVININKTEDKQKININTADKNELMSIRGIGNKKADLIIAYRPYKSIWDLSKIDGISEDFIKNIEEEVSVNAES